jgi:hypothetical protein
MRVQTITLSYPDDAHIECIIAPRVWHLKEFCLELGITWERKVVDHLDQPDPLPDEPLT